MKIYTRKGDKGFTQLIGGVKVAKHNLRIDAYGTVDELNSWIGLVHDSIEDSKMKNILNEIQDRLFTIGSHLASDPAKSKMKVPDIKMADVEMLEKAIDVMQLMLPPLKSFVLPGGNSANSICHIARCVCRRTERLVSHLNNEAQSEPVILMFLNRLSDFLFVLARKISYDTKSKEIQWKPRL